MASGGTDNKLADEAIEQAAKYLTTKVDKQHRKHSKEEKAPTKGDDGYLKLSNECHCEEEKQEIEEGRKSQLLRSPATNRKVMRREGVAEKNESEKKLVKEAVESIAVSSNLTDYNLML